MGQILSADNTDNNAPTDLNIDQKTQDVSQVGQAEVSISPDTVQDSNSTEIEVTLSVEDIASQGDTSEQHSKSVQNQKNKHSVLSDKAKVILAQELLKVHVHNAGLDLENTKKQLTHDLQNAQSENSRNEMMRAQGGFIMKTLLEAERANVRDLELENRMLRQSLETYKELYMKMSRSIEELRQLAGVDNDLTCDGASGDENTDTSMRTGGC